MGLWAFQGILVLVLSALQISSGYPLHGPFFSRGLRSARPAFEYPGDSEFVYVPQDSAVAYYPESSFYPSDVSEKYYPSDKYYSPDKYYTSDKYYPRARPGTFYPDEEQIGDDYGQEKWFESGSNADANAVFLDNLVLSQLYSDSLERAKNNGGKYVYGERVSAPRSDYEEEEEEDEDEEDGDEQVRELRELAKKSESLRKQDFMGDNTIPDRRLEDLFARSGMSSIRIPSITPTVTEAPQPSGWNGATAGAARDHHQPDRVPQASQQGARTSSSSRKGPTPAPQSATSSTSESHPSTTTPSSQQKRAPQHQLPVQGGMPEVAMLRPAAPPRPAPRLVQRTVSRPGQLSHHSGVDEVRSLLRAQEDQYLALLKEPAKGLMEKNRPHKRFVADEGSLVKELNALKNDNE